MTDLTGILGGVFRPQSRMVDPPAIQLRSAIESAGLTPPDEIFIDGQIHRFRPGTKGRTGEDKAGWYIAYPDGIPAGRFGDWRSSIESSWRADIGRDLTAGEEIAYRRRQDEAIKVRDEARAKMQAEVAETVSEIWDARSAAEPEHPYLQRKGIQPHGARITGDGRLMVPMVNAEDHLVSLQYISHDGTKRYHTGGQAGGAHWCIGQTSEPGPVYMAEGFATAATIFEVTGRPCYVAFSAQNIPAVAAIARAKYPELVIVADNDASGVGANHAYEAAAKHGARVILPPEEGQDANDYYQAGGDLRQLLAGDSAGWLIQADDFSAEPNPIRWLIKRWIQADATVMIFGPSGGGKTFAVLDMVLHISSGLEEWQGNKVRPGSVVYLAGEGHHGLRGRIAGWKQHHGVRQVDMWVSSSGCDFNTAEGYGKAAAAIRSLPKPPSVAVIDTLHRFMAGDENSAQDAKTMLDACGSLQREFGCTVILVHHTGVSEEAQHRARGSSAWRGAMDIEIGVKPSKNGPIQLLQSKAKDSETAEPIWATLESMPINGWKDEDGDPVTTAILQAAEAPKAGRKESDVAEDMKKLDAAWFDSGAEEIGGKPYVTRSALRAKLEEFGLKTSTINTYLNPSKGRMIDRLVSREILTPEKDGWVVSDSAWASQMMVRK